MSDTAPAADGGVDWSAAVCRTYPTHLAMQIWFCEPDNTMAVSGGTPYTPATWELVRRAVDICHTCPIRRDCLDFSLRERIKFGVWGGVSQRRRRQMMGREGMHKKGPAAVNRNGR